MAGADGLGPPIDPRYVAVAAPGAIFAMSVVAAVKTFPAPSMAMPVAGRLTAGLAAAGSGKTKSNLVPLGAIL